MALLLAGLAHQVCAQKPTEISVRQQRLKFIYSHEGRQLNNTELYYMLNGHAGAKRELKRAQKNSLPATLLSCAGGILLGYQVRNHITGDRPDWALAGVGAGLLVLQIPFSGAVMKRKQLAVYHYNQGYAGM